MVRTLSNLPCPGEWASWHFGDCVHCLFKLLLEWDPHITTSASPLTLWGYSPSRTACPSSTSWAALRALKCQLLRASCVSDSNCVSFLLGIGMCCPTWWSLAEMNSPILVGLDLVGVGSCFLGEENVLTWCKRERLVAAMCTAFPWMGLLGVMAPDTGRSCVHGY